MNKHFLNLFKEKAASIGVDLKTILIDEMQAFFLEEFYKNPASVGTVLFGGGRLRHLNNSIRFSVDLDFYQTKGFNYSNIKNFISSKFIDLLKDKFGISSRIIEIPPWQKTHIIETIRLLVYNEDFYQIELDFDLIMREPYLDCAKELLRNVVIIAGNALEIIEEKLISIYEREPLKIRDIFDFWYYREMAKDLDKINIQKKLAERGISKEIIKNRVNNFIKYRDYYLKEIKNILISCGLKREEVRNLLGLDMSVILEYIINMTNGYLLPEEK